MLRNRKERKMKTIFLTRHAETEDIGSSLHKVFSEIEQITEQDYNVVKLKNDLSTKRDLDTWILRNAMHTDLLITSDPYALKVLKENGWQGKTILKALGGFPRGASSFRGAMPYLYRSDVVWFTCRADMQIYESIVTHDGTQPEAICIPYHMDPDTYQPLKSSESRQKLRSAWRFKQDDFVLIYAGRVTIEKNVHAIIEAVAELTRLGDPVKLVLVGKIENVPFREFQMHPVNVEEKIKTLIENAGVSDRVVIQEWQTPEKLNEVLNAADAFINLTLHHDENFGLSQIEAMSAGLPVIGTAWGGLKDTIINQEVGFAIDTWVTKNGIRFDAPAVIEAIKGLMENTQLREIQSQRAREHAVTNYNNISYREQLTQLIETTLHESMQPKKPSFTPFGSRFHQKFKRKGYIPKHSSRARAPDPVCDSLSDPDYMELIAPYTSRTQHTLEPNSQLFCAMTGQLNGKFFISEDLLYSLRIPIVSEEADVIHQLNRWQNVPRQGLNLSNELLNRLIQKGVIGVSKEMQ